MTLTIEAIRTLVKGRQAVISDHAYERMEEGGIDPREVLDGVDAGLVIEEYPDFHKGPSVLALQADAAGQPIHAVWGLRAGTAEPVVLVTAYRPDPSRWTDEFRRRR
jgi:hypothetical protein